MAIYSKRWNVGEVPHAPGETEALQAIRQASSAKAAYWNGLMPMRGVALDFQNKLKFALTNGGFRRVDPSQLTPGILQDPSFSGSELSEIASVRVPFSTHGASPFLAVHQNGPVLHFGVLTKLSDGTYFKPNIGKEGGVAFVNLKDEYNDWPACDQQSDRQPPVRWSLFWAPPALVK